MKIRYDGNDNYSLEVYSDLMFYGTIYFNTFSYTGSIEFDLPHPDLKLSNEQILKETEKILEDNRNQIEDFIDEIDAYRYNYDFKKVTSFVDPYNDKVVIKFNINRK